MRLVRSDPDDARAERRDEHAGRRRRRTHSPGETPEPASVAAILTCLSAHDRVRAKTKRRRRHVVHPEAEREAAGTFPRLAVEDDGVHARSGGERSGGWDGGEVGVVEVRVPREGKAGVSGEAVLVLAGDDARLDLDAPGSSGHDDAEVRHTTRDSHAVDGLRTGEHRRNVDAARVVRDTCSSIRGSGGLAWFPRRRRASSAARHGGARVRRRSLARRTGCAERPAHAGARCTRRRHPA